LTERRKVKVGGQKSVGLAGKSDALENEDWAVGAGFSGLFEDRIKRDPPDRQGGPLALVGE
jgi:hypothetical protein